MIMKATEIVNPVQILVMTLDQVLYSIMQWTWSSIYDEEKYIIVLMSGLHIEIALLMIDWRKVVGLS